MFKKYYFVHLVERNIRRDATDWNEWTGLVKAKNPMEALALAKQHANRLPTAPKEGYLLREIKRV